MEESANKEQRKLTLTDKFAREKERKDISDWKTIYLYREGTFLRAFNASAWLLATFVYNDEFRKQVGGKQPLQVQHLMSKTNGDYIFAGFPVASIDKYVTMCDKRDENSDVVVLTMYDIIAPLFQTAEEYEEAYAKYLASLPPAKEKKDKPKQQQKKQPRQLQQRTKPMTLPTHRKCRPTLPRSSTTIRRSKATTATGGSGTPIPTNTRTLASLREAEQCTLRSSIVAMHSICKTTAATSKSA